MTFTTDIDINKAYPAVEYDATESGFTYFEDREVTGFLYRAQNATYTPGTGWAPKVTGQSAFATVQNADGSIGHLEWSSTSSAWTGNGQRGIYNVRDFGAKADGSDDSGAIQAANDAAVSSGDGGYIYLPTGTYTIQNFITLGSTDPLKKDIPITIGGDGAGRTILLASQTLNAGQTPPTIMMLVNAQYGNVGTGPFQSNIYVEKMTLNAQADYNHPAGLSVRGPIFLKEVLNCGVRDCEVISSSNHGILISGTGSTSWPSATVLNFQVLRNHVNLNAGTTNASTYPGNIPIRVEGAAVGIIHGNTIGDLNSQPTNDAIDCPGSSFIECSSNYVTMCGDGMGANACSNVIFANNRIVGPQGYGIATFSSGGPDDGVSGVSYLTITGNVVINPGKSGIRVSCPPGGPAPTDFSVTNNVVTLGVATSPYGIHIEASQGCVTGNVVDLGNTGNTAIAIDSAQAYNPGPPQTFGNTNVTVTGNTVSNGGSGSSGIVITGTAESKSIDCVITDNSVFGVTSVFSGLNHVVNCVVRDNPSINPYTFAVTTPAISSSPVPNPYPFDIWVTVSGASDVLINGHSSGVTSGSILLPAGPANASAANTITLVYVGTPTWTWLAY